MKQCRECGEMKPLAEFYAHKMMADGHLNKCKSCVKARVADHRALNLEAIREYDRARAADPKRIVLRKQVAERWKTDPELRAKHARQKAAWSKKNSEKYRAHTMINNAIRDGKLDRQPCSQCGNTKADAHHDDYSKPLDVMWLCRQHHAEYHTLLRELQRDPDHHPQRNGRNGHRADYPVRND